MKANVELLLKYMMTFSDANPVQWWLIDCDTYNEEERYGQNSRCFCAPWECDDEIKTQFQDEAAQNFVLLIYDDEASLLDSIPIEETEDGVYLIAFTPSDNTPDFCDKKIQLQIRKEAGTQGVSLPALDQWLNSSLGSNPDWSLGSSPSVSVTTVSSEYLYVDYAFISGVEYSIQVTFTKSNTTIGNQFDIYIMDSSFNVLVSDPTPNVFSNAGVHTTDPLLFTATSSTTRIALRVSGGFGSTTFTINSTDATRQIGSDEVVAKSDCLNVKAEQVGTILIEYSNFRNYAGIINNNGSPDLTFYLRIPAVFNEERFPETDEPLQLSNNRIISLNSQVKKQRLLETDQMPNYMHLKMMEVLKHQFVTIDDVDYVKEEPYEQVENSNKRWPMRRYTCWLTEKGYVVRNIL